MKIPRLDTTFFRNVAWKNITLIIIAFLVLIGFEEQQARKYAPEIESALESVLQEIESGESERFFVSKVYDGDTFTLLNKEKVRLIGINAPEIGEPFATASREFLVNLVEGREVVLIKDKSDRDKYQRLLRYVYVDDVFVNEALVREGLAWATEYYPDTKEQAVLDSAEGEAKENALGVWGDSE